jgi:hypothetical protein
MSLKFLAPPSDDTRFFSCVHRASRAVEAHDVPLTQAQSSALAETQDRAAQAYCGGHAMLAPTPVTRMRAVCCTPTRAHTTR